MSLANDARESLKGPTPGTGAAIRAVERALIGALFLDNGTLGVAKIDGLRSEHLSSAGHRLIYNAVLSRAKQKAGFNAVLVAADLESDGQLETIGGAAYLSYCLDNTDVELIGEYVSVVKQAALERRLSKNGGRP